MIVQLSITVRRKKIINKIFLLSYSLPSNTFLLLDHHLHSTQRRQWVVLSFVDWLAPLNIVLQQIHIDQSNTNCINILKYHNVSSKYPVFQLFTLHFISKININILNPFTLLKIFMLCDGDITCCSILWIKLLFLNSCLH